LSEEEGWVGKNGVWVAAVARHADAERGRGRSPRCRRNARTSYYNNIRRTARYLNHYNIYAHTCVACWHAIRVNNNDTIHTWCTRVYSRLPTDIRIINIVVSYHYFARRPVNGVVSAGRFRRRRRTDGSEFIIIILLSFYYNIMIIVRRSAADRATRW